VTSFSIEDADRLDFELMRDGAVKLFCQCSILNSHLEWLTAQGYRVVSIDCRDKEPFFLQMSAAFEFKKNFGYEDWDGNLDALNDAFRHLDFESVTGLVLHFQAYDLLARADSRLAQGVLDLIECHSRENLLLGRRLLSLVQSNDPKLYFSPVGGRNVLWNRLEWLDSSRQK